MQILIAGLDSDDVDIAIQSYSILSSLVEVITQDNIGSLSILSRPDTLDLYERLASPTGRALSVICKGAQERQSQGADDEARVCQLLAELIGR